MDGVRCPVLRVEIPFIAHPRNAILVPQDPYSSVDPLHPNGPPCDPNLRCGSVVEMCWPRD